MEKFALTPMQAIEFIYQNDLGFDQGEGLSPQGQISCHSHFDTLNYAQPSNICLDMPHSPGAHGVMYLCDTIPWTAPPMPTSLALNSI